MKFVLARPWLEFGEFWKTDFQFDFGKIAGRRLTFIILMVLDDRRDVGEC